MYQNGRGKPINVGEIQLCQLSRFYGAAKEGYLILVFSGNLIEYRFQEERIIIRSPEKRDQERLIFEFFFDLSESFRTDGFDLVGVVLIGNL
jgi:hypothetical protein